MKTLALLALTLTSLSAHAAQDFSERVGHKRLELAHVLNKAYEAGNICEADAYPNEIVREVARARYMVKESTLKKFVKAIGPKAKIRQDLAFRNAIGAINVHGTEQSTAELTQAMIGTKFYHFGQGAYGSGYNVTLQENGVAHENIMEVLNDEPWVRWKEGKTTWNLVPNQNAQFLAHNLRVGDTEFRLEVKEGEMWWVPTDVKEGETDYLHTLSTSDAYCDA